MNLQRRQICALLLSLGLPATSRAAGSPLVFGLFPNLSPANQLARYLPMARYLEEQLNRPVELFTAKNFRAFIESRRRGDFDLIVTAPHLAWLAAEETGYQPLIQFSGKIRATLIVAATSSLRSPQYLKGHDIAVPDPLALVTLLAQQRLEQVGLTRDRDYRFISRGNHNNVMLAVALGDYTAGVVSINNLAQFSPGLRTKVRAIDATDTTPGIFMMAHSRLQPPLRQAIRMALLHFAGTVSGKEFMRQVRMGEIMPANPQDLAGMARYALLTRELFKVLP